MIKSYVINLDCDIERLNFFKQNFARLNLQFERIPAVDGRKYSEEDYQQFMRERPRKDKTWRRGQMGCFLSHYAAWEKIARGDERFGVVFEDDIHISDDLKLVLDNDQWIPDNIDVIRLDAPTCRVKLSRSPVLVYRERKAYEVSSTTWCCGGYILGKQAAQRLIDVPVQDHEPSDVLMYSYTDSVIARELKILQFQPALCAQDKQLEANNINFASNIETPPSQTEVLKSKLSKASPATILRALYRSATGYKRIGFQ